MNNREVMHAIGHYKTKPKQPPNLKNADCCAMCKFGETQYESVDCELFPDEHPLLYEICDEYIRRKENE